MISRARKVTSGLHLPLRRAALCMDCDEVFEMGDGGCPACGSKTWSTLARFLDMAPGKAGRGTRPPPAPPTKSERARMTRHLLIVARNRTRLYEHFRRVLARNSAIQVVLDRRVGNRRSKGVPVPVDRRAPIDRRTRSNIDEQLREIGWSLVLLDLLGEQTNGHRAER
jgi:hypothetical protein